MSLKRIGQQNLTQGFEMLGQDFTTHDCTADGFIFAHDNLEINSKNRVFQQECVAACMRMTSAAPCQMMSCCRRS